MLISFVIPCYRSEKTLAAVAAETDAAMREAGFEYEMVFVNDGSPDNTWEVIKDLCGARKDRTGIDLARNFGQHAALMAGIRKTRGDIVICLDDDGQTPACEAGKLIKAIEDGADVAYAKYDVKQHSAFRNFGTVMNDKMTQVMLGKPKDLFLSSYFAMKRFVADEVLRYEQAYPYLVGLVLRSTKNIVNVPVTHRRRETGQSGYTLSKLFGLWLNGFTAFSVKPLRIASLFGTAFAVLGFLYGIYTVIKKFVNPAVPVGFSALISAVVFIGGMMMLMLGMVGEYVGRTYLSVNGAPQYVIRQTAGGTDGADEKGADSTGRTGGVK